MKSPPDSTPLFRAAAVTGLSAVGLGAFGAHALEGALTGADAAKRLGWWETAGQYHLLHAAVLVAVAYGAATHPDAAARRQLSRAGWLFVLGVVVFSGSLYLMTLGAPRFFGMITPLGGLTLMAGWTWLVWSARAIATRS